MDSEQADFYSMPEIYDVLHLPGTVGEVRALERICRDWCGSYGPAGRANAARGGSGGRRMVWLEPACGSGRLLRVAAARGHGAIGFDREPGMVQYAVRIARESGVKVRAFVGDMTQFADEVGEGIVDFAFNPINSIRHLGSDRAMVAHFREMRRVLRAGGVYAVGLSLSAYGLEAETEDVWRGRGRGMTVTQVVQYLPPAGPEGKNRFEPVISHLVVRSGQGKSERFRDIDSTYKLRGYNLAQWRDIIRRGGMDVVAVLDDRGRPTAPVEPGYAVWVLGASAGARG